jgi:hypothetical protein
MRDRAIHAYYLSDTLDFRLVCQRKDDALNLAFAQGYPDELARPDHTSRWNGIRKGPDIAYGGVNCHLGVSHRTLLAT